MALLLLLVIPFATLVNTEESSSSSQDETCSNNSDASCQDNKPASNECPFWAKNGECEKNPTYMTVECRKSCGICTDNAGVAQTRTSDFHKVTTDQTTRRLEETQTYLQSIKPELKALCKNENELCTVWAVAGECEKNPECEFIIILRLACFVVFLSLTFLIFSHENKMCCGLSFLRLFDH